MKTSSLAQLFRALLMTAALCASAKRRLPTCPTSDEGIDGAHPHKGDPPKRGTGRQKRLYRILQAALLLGSIAATVLAQSPSPQAKRTENPALKRFGAAITFYLSFDDEALHADLANGKSEPTSVDGEPQYLPGLYGKAMLLSGVSKHGSWVSVDYSTTDNVDLTKPGAVAVWLSPRDWVRGDAEDLFYPIKIMSGGAQLMFGRQGQLINPMRRNDMVFLWAKVGGTKDISLAGGGSLGWKNDEWHLWVMNWRSNSIEFSLDGGALQRQDLPAKIPVDGERAGHFFIAMQIASCRYLLDEILALDRPLDGDEIKWMYEQGKNVGKGLGGREEGRRDGTPSR